MSPMPRKTPMPRTDGGRAARRGLLVLAVCGLACATAVAMAIHEWRAAIDPVAAAVPAGGSGARGRLPAGAAPTLPAAGAVARAAAGSAEDTAVPPINRRHRRGHGARAAPEALALRALGAQLTAELHTLRPRLEACAGRDAMPRSVRLDVETGDGEARIVGAPAPGEGSEFHRCAEQTLRGRTVPSPGVKAGRRTSMVVPL